jgi:HEAT repeat protein
LCLGRSVEAIFNCFLRAWEPFIVDDFKRQEYWAGMRNDPRSIDELVFAALNESDEETAWNAVTVLHFRGTKQVLEKAEALCHSKSAVERRLGADILGQLGVPRRTYPRECVSLLVAMLDQETNADVLQAIFVAFSHLGESDAIEPALKYQGYPDSEVRHGVVLALTGCQDERAIDALIELSHDQDALVRDWATFALGQQSTFDTPAIRTALADRLTDSDYETRCEAIMGLALRGDRRVIPFISKELTSNSVGCLILEASAAIADPTFYPLLLAIRNSASQESSDESDHTWIIDKIDEAIESCRPPIANDEQST